MKQLSAFFIFILFFSMPSLASQKDASILANIASADLYELNIKDLRRTILPYLKEKSYIKSFKVIDLSDNQPVFTYKVQGNSYILNEAIDLCPQDKNFFTANITYMGDTIGRVEICISQHNNNLNIAFTQEEEKWLQEHPTIHVGGEKDWAPFDFVDENGNYNGLAKDYLDLIAHYGGFNVEYHTRENWNQLLEDIKTGKIDMLPAININEERKKFISFTNAYIKLPEYYFTLTNYQDLYSLTQLNDKKISNVKGYALTDWLRKNYPNIEIIEKNSIAECLQSVKSGETVAYIGDNPSTTYNLEKNFITGIRLNNPVRERDAVKLYMGVKKEYTIFTNIINKIITKIPKDKISKISSKWMKIIEKKTVVLTKEEKIWLENNPITRIGVMEYWPSDKNGNSLHTGILKLINRYSGLNLVPIKYKVWKNAFDKASQGDELSGIMGLSWSKEREKQFLYTPAYDFTPSYLITKVSNNEIKSFQDLEDKTIYLKSNSIISKMMKDKSPSTKIINIANTNEIYQKLSTTNEADAMLIYFIDEKKLEEYNLKIVKTIYDRYGEVAIGINKKYPQLHSIVDKAFKTIPKNELSYLRDQDWENKKDKNKYELSTKELKYLKKRKQINICINPNWEPLEFYGNGTAQGISIDLLNIIKEKLNLEYNFINTTSWSQSQQYLKEKKCDILPTAVVTKKRKEYANFTDPYLNYDLAIITTSDKPLVKNLDSIASETMSRKEGSGLISQLKKKYPYLNIKESAGYKESLQDVINGNVYFTITTLPVFSYYKSKYGLKNLQIAGYTDLKYNLCVAVRKDDKTLLGIMNKAVKSIPKSTYNVVHDKWATAKVITSTDWNLIFKISGVILLIVLFLLWNNKKLQKLVNLKTADLQKQKKELEILFKSFDKNVIFSRTDLEGVITQASEAFCKISGYTQKELIGQPHSIVRHPDMPKEAFEKMWYRLQRKESFELEVKNLKKDGSFYWVKSQFEPDFDTEGNHIGYSALRIDITDKKAVEELSKNLEEKVEMRTKELEIAKLEVEEIHKHTKDSIEYAYLIQEALIPDSKLFKNYFEDSFTIWHPKDVVGGDIYLFEGLRNENECLLMVIDCTGHGVPGAFVTMLVKAIERQITSKIINNNEIVSPAKILSIFNKSMKHLLRQEDEKSISNAGFDGGILYYNKKEQIIKFSGAETPLFYFDENNKLNTIKGSRHSVGYKKSDSSYEFKENVIKVKKGMSFYLITDGYIDQNGGKKSFPFGKKRFSKILEDNIDKSFNEQRNILLNKLDEYQGTETRNDDVTLVGVKI